MNRFPQVLSEALREWTNLRSFTLTPYQYPQALVTQTLETLPQCSYLRSLTVSGTCCSEVVPLLIKIGNLESLTIDSPGRAILNFMPEWLEHLSMTLTGLHLKVSLSCARKLSTHESHQSYRTIVALSPLVYFVRLFPSAPNSERLLWGSHTP